MPFIKQWCIWYRVRKVMAIMILKCCFFLNILRQDFTLVAFSLCPQVSKSLCAAFGRDSPGAQWTLSFLLETIQSSLNAWQSEQATSQDILQLLVTLMDNKTRFVGTSLIIIPPP